MFKFEGRLYLLITDLGYARESRWEICKLNSFKRHALKIVQS